MKHSNEHWRSLEMIHTGIVSLLFLSLAIPLVGAFLGWR